MGKCKRIPAGIASGGLWGSVRKTWSTGPNGAEPNQDRNNNKWSGVGIESSREKEENGKRRSLKKGAVVGVGLSLVWLLLYSSNGMALAS